ncbi:MAG: sugar phosphate isomerase/epimerase family protein, partial [Opitutales bacterium]
MKNLIPHLGIQSYCFRGSKDLGTVLTRLKACGVTTIELCGVHVNFADTKNSDTAIAQCKAAGVSIVCLGVERFRADLPRERQLAEFARKAGARVISVDFEPGAGPEVFRAAEKLADDYDLRLAIHN